MHMLAKGYWEKMCCCSVAKLYPILCNPMNCMQHSRLPRLSLSPRVCSYSCPFSQWCHPTISSSVAPSPPAVNLSQHQGLFQWVCSLHQVAKVLELQLQHQSFQRTFRTDFRLTGLTSLLSKGFSRVFHSTSFKASIFQCSAFFIFF